MVTSNPILSVIVPIYNVELYIEKCIRSLFEQTLLEIEYVFVNDKSPDRSVEILNDILEDYPSRKSNVKLISNAYNMGIGGTRQVGINNASGKYIIHCDPDDWVDVDYYEKLVAKAENEGCGMVLSDYYVEHLNKSIYISQNPGHCDIKRLCDRMGGLSSNRFQGSLWNKLVRREYYDGYNFPQNITFCEDFLFLIHLRDYQIKIGYIESASYHYRMIPVSITNSYNFVNIDRENSFLKAIDELANKNKISRSFRNSVIENVLFHRIIRMKDMPEEYFRANYKKYRNVIKSNKQLNFIASFILYIAFTVNLKTAQSILSYLQNAVNFIR